MIKCDSCGTKVNVVVHVTVTNYKPVKANPIPATKEQKWCVECIETYL